jgi:hypothetical protein
MWYDSLVSVPRTLYARSGDVHLAYQVIGEGNRERDRARARLDQSPGGDLGAGVRRGVSVVADPGRAGSGLTFDDRGEHTLKGVPERWALYAAHG